jgi:hypothetical protein
MPPYGMRRAVAQMIQKSLPYWAASVLQLPPPGRREKRAWVLHNNDSRHFNSVLCALAHTPTTIGHRSFREWVARQHFPTSSTCLPRLYPGSTKKNQVKRGIQ